MPCLFEVQFNTVVRLGHVICGKENDVKIIHVSGYEEMSEKSADLMTELINNSKILLSVLQQVRHR